MLALTSVAMAKDITLSFYYPIAVGGPIPKIIDGYVADFEKENPGIKIKAIYAGTYQDTLVKALTAFKSGEPPDIAVLLSTDMFTLIDEDAIAPFDDLLKTDADKAWLKSFYPAFMENSQTGGKDLGHSVPALDHRDVLEQGRVQGGGARSRQGARHLGRTGRRRQETRSARWRRQCQPMGDRNSVDRLSLLAVPGPDHGQQRAADERGRHADGISTSRA